MDGQSKLCFQLMNMQYKIFANNIWYYVRKGSKKHIFFPNNLILPAHMYFWSKQKILTLPIQKHLRTRKKLDSTKKAIFLTFSKQLDSTSS